MAFVGVVRAMVSRLIIAITVATQQQKKTSLLLSG